MDMATDADINIEHRLTEVEQRAKVTLIDLMSMMRYSKAIVR